MQAVTDSIAKEEIEKLRAEAQMNKDHMLQVKCIFNFTCNLYLVVMFMLKCIFSMQYKSIAQVNEFALKQIESAHEIFKIEVIWMLHYT